MQIFFHLNATGQLDSKTLAAMRAPRCGVPDVNNYSSLEQRNRWSKNRLTYRISAYTSRLPPSKVNSLIASALKVWSDASSLSFEPANGPNADIVISFARRAHGDSYPFDGPGGTLAHAFGPGEGVGGDTHFDEDEKWTATQTGFNLYLVAAHEFGHSLGLSHSSNPSSLMYPTYKTRITNGSPLSNEDRQMVTKIYGSKFWSITNLKVRKKPTKISSLGFPAGVDEINSAVHINKTGKTLFFVGENYWSYDESTHTMDMGYPENITGAFPGISGKLDAVIELNGFLHFIIGPNSYKYDYETLKTVEVGKANTWLGC
ncbi:matrix metalloproteinase-20-like [Rhinatrema bivittatum]|uniref:matrix metalloproteinase-20-like n=1 Tax=Rhinatrema bivittatum TaxID=194408 RepID=UPI00112BE241|nr:matrix metalloproteinase-20-like [Rhinatrema bivittatum]